MPSRTYKGKVEYAYFWEGVGKDRKKKWYRLGDDQETADIKYGELLERLRSRKNHASVNPDKISWKSFTDEYLETYSRINKAPESYASDKLIIENFNRLVPIQTMAQMTARNLDQFKALRKREDVVESTINRQLVTLLHMGEKAVEWGYFEANPWESVKMFTVERNKPPAYSLKEKAAIWRACNDSLERVVVGLGLYAGLRRKEMANLKLSDILWNQSKLHVVSSMRRRTKSKRERFIPLHPDLTRDLKVYIREFRPREYLFETYGECSPSRHLGDVFNKRILHRATVGGSYGDKATRKIPKIGSLHKLRHTYATDLLADGADLETVRDLMGHTQISTTQIYLHTDEQRKKQAVNRLMGRKMVEKNGR